MTRIEVVTQPPVRTLEEWEEHLMAICLSDVLQQMCDQYGRIEMCEKRRPNERQADHS